MRIKQALIDEVMDSFNFKKVRKAMQLMDLQWEMEEGIRMPSENEMKDVVICLIDIIQRGLSNQAMANGFLVTYENNELDVSFILTQYTAYEA